VFFTRRWIQQTDTVTAVTLISSNAQAPTFHGMPTGLWCVNSFVQVAELYVLLHEATLSQTQLRSESLIKTNHQIMIVGGRIKQSASRCLYSPSCEPLGSATPGFFSNPNLSIAPAITKIAISEENTQQRSGHYNLL